MSLVLKERPAWTADEEVAARFVGAVVASAFRIVPDAMRAGRRGPASVAFARQVAIYLSHTRFGLDYATAGSLFGRDRTTAAYACRRVEDRREDPTLDAILDYLERALDVWSFSGSESRGQA
jgi:chromosomal replication initiation ATPase DnaA